MLTLLLLSRNDCTAIGRLADVEGTDVYCHRQCLRYPSTCPKDECHCVEKIDTGDPSIVLDRASKRNAALKIYTNDDGYKVEEYEDDETKYKIISAF